MQTGNEVKQRRFAASRWSHDAQKFPRTNFEIDMVQGE
jgi:hypothetical protein